MLSLGPLGFAVPAVLPALIALPVLWLILRAIPPRPREVTFPGIALLYGLADVAQVSRRTPWWLLMLRVAAVAAAILAAAGPVWRPVAGGDFATPLLVVADAGWAAAPGWTAAQARGVAALDTAGQAGRPAALLLADRAEGALVFADAAQAAAALRAAQPQPWETVYPASPATALADAPERFDTLWLSDGLDHPGRAAWLAALGARGAVTVAPPEIAPRTLSVESGDPPVLIAASTIGGALPAIQAIGPDPQGTARVLATLPPPEPVAEGGIFTARVPITLPSELRNRVTRFALDGVGSAGAVILADDRVRRRKVALLTDGRETEGQALLSPLHYLRGALTPFADVVYGGLSEVLPAAPDVIVMADQPAPDDPSALLSWVEQGGLLLRFGGPRMAAAAGLSDDPLTPVRLRPGGRDMGGALSWGAPRGIAPFAADGLFAGLTPPPEATVRAQLLPEPAPDLAAATLARLSDGTPLVTRRERGKGALVLVHTSADAEWSTLPLSGLFPQMLRRLIDSAAGRATSAPQGAEAASWTPVEVLDGFGRVTGPGDRTPVSARDFAAGPAPGIPAGVYEGGGRQVALNAARPMVPATWPGATVATASAQAGRSIFGPLMAAALLALAADALVSALIAGRRRGVLA